MKDQQVRLEPSPRWVRATYEGKTVVDSKRVMLMLEQGRTPVYYFPEEDIVVGALTASVGRKRHPYLGEVRFWSLQAGGRLTEKAAWQYPEPPEGLNSLEGHIAFDWNAMDAWFEEDDRVFVHARDPYKRVDVLRSSRHVRIVIDGMTIAETHRPALLFETGLPTRYYIPLQDVRTDLLEASDSHTQCPYKGVASYWSVRAKRVHKDIAWYYPFPIPECPKIEGLIAFYTERVEDIYVDGKKLDRD